MAPGGKCHPFWGDPPGCIAGGPTQNDKQQLHSLPKTIQNPTWKQNRIKAAMNQHISTKPGKSLDSKTCPIFKVRNVQVIQVTQTYPKRSKNANAAGLVWGFE